MDTDTWFWDKSKFVEVDYPLFEYNPVEYLCFIEIRQAYLEDGYIDTPDDFDEVYIKHSGTAEGVIEAIQERFGVKLRLREDIGPIVFEILVGV